MILKDAPESSSFLYADEGIAQVASGPNSVSSTRDGGNFVNGPLSLSSPPDSLKLGGVFRLNPLVATCLPSTMITPIPTLIIDMPVSNITSMMSVAAMVLSVL